jgi:hypothetical protein
MTNSDLLYHYFSNTLTPDLEAEFNTRLAQDPEFKAQLEYENNLKAAITAEHTAALKSKLKGFEATHHPSPKATWRFNWKIAASILIIIGASWWGYGTFFTTNYASLYATHFKVYPNTAYPITRGDTLNTLERKAFLAYERKAYTEALVFLEQLNTSYSNFYKAQAYLGVEHPQKALPLLAQEISKHGTFTAEAHWYLALIAIQQKEKLTAKTHLEALIATYSYNKTQAQALLEQL